MRSKTSLVLGCASILAGWSIVAGAQSPRPPEPRARELARALCAAPRLAGTIGSVWGAKACALELERAGFEVELDWREVVLALPRRVELAIFADERATRPIRERRDRFDPRAVPPGDIPMFNGWSPSGELRGPVVDAGYGTRADFERLRAGGVELAGKVALVRYGRAYRGVKVDLAAEHGAAGVLLFGDPADDGARKGETWPFGPWKNPNDAQRGSINPMGRTPGDPSTPGYASPPPNGDVERASPAELAASLPPIPCIPVSANEAEAILERLARDAQGQAIGPGPVEARVLVDAPLERRAIVNVIATLRGASDDYVIAGGHRDSWVRGANDNGSGIVVLIRAAEHLARRVADGWRPKSTIKIALWDAEEWGLIGSTEWGEAHADQAREHALLYVNFDAACSGTQVNVSGAPGVFALAREVLQRVPSAETREDGEVESLWQQWTAKEERSPASLGLPGSGSDFAVFLHHLGVPTMEIGFGGNRAGQYHARQDEFALVDRYLDPGWIGHELAGRCLAELLEVASDRGAALFDEREAAEAMAALARKGAAAGDDAWLSAERAERLAASFDALAAASASSSRGAERCYVALARPGGVDGRPWFKNVLWAPALESGYGAESFPTLRAASRRGDDELERELAALIGAISALRERRARTPGEPRSP